MKHGMKKHFLMLFHHYMMVYFPGFSGNGLKIQGHAFCCRNINIRMFRGKQFTRNQSENKVGTQENIFKRIENKKGITIMK